jgi:hypothetical protein
MRGRGWALRLSLSAAAVGVVAAVVLRARSGLASPCLTEPASPEALLPRQPPAAPGSDLPSGAAGPAFEQLEPFESPHSWRFGIGVPYGAAQAAWVPRLGAGWWYSWQVQEPAGVEMWQMIRLKGGRLFPSELAIGSAARANPGGTWIVGNEPDVIWQDNLMPECLAYLYHEAYTLLKRSDPTAAVAMGGVAQASPLRMAYLDKVLKAYEQRYGESMPVDLWTMHAFILREARGSWGAEIPPGLEDDSGWLVDVDQHDDLEKFKAQVAAFRQWMAAQGYGDRPLVITEYGILMPAEYGFGPERAAKFMTTTFDYLLAARDTALGLPSDDYHLVQRWAWFSLADSQYPTGDLVNVWKRRLTPLGEAYRDYVSGLR